MNFFTWSSESSVRRRVSVNMCQCGFFFLFVLSLVPWRMRRRWKKKLKRKEAEKSPSAKYTQHTNVCISDTNTSKTKSNFNLNYRITMAYFAIVKKKRVLFRSHKQWVNCIEIESPEGKPRSEHTDRWLDERHNWYLKTLCPLANSKDNSFAERVIRIHYHRPLTQFFSFFLFFSRLPSFCHGSLEYQTSSYHIKL